MTTASFSQALSLQARVLWALSLREIHGKHGKSKLGYLWQLIKTAFGIAVFWWIRTIAGFGTPHGMPLPLFLLMGFIPWYIFSSGIRMVMEAVRTNKALLTFPQVSPLDLYCSSGLVTWVTEVISLGIFLGILTLAGYKFQLYDPLSLFCSLVGLGFFTLGLGIILSCLTLYLPVIEKIVPMCLRILFFISGIFFSPTQLSGRFSDILFWNPLVSFIEIARGAYVTRSPSPDVKILYITCLTCAFLAVGLLLERYVRPKQQSRI